MQIKNATCREGRVALVYCLGNKRCVDAKFFEGAVSGSYLHGAFVRQQCLMASLGQFPGVTLSGALFTGGNKHAGVPYDTEKPDGGQTKRWITMSV